MKKQIISERKFLAPLLFLMIFVIGAMGCEESAGDSDGDEEPACTVHEDCPEGYSCKLSEGVCALDDNATPCSTDVDCANGYSCYISLDNTSGVGKCIPDPTDGDGVADGDSNNCSPCTMDSECADPVNQFCMTGCCEERYPLCPSGSRNECWPGQECKLQADNTYRCVDKSDPTDGDIDDKEDGDQIEAEDGDEDQAVDGDTSTCTGGTCQRSSDCTDGKVCGAGGCCVEHCSTAGCPNGGECNTNNGYCEWCEETCSPNQCCNYHENFWYCGSCCVPPCAENQACQGGNCVDLVCPTCGECEKCDAGTGYHCVEDPGACGPDGDAGERGATNCLPANAACVDGVDVCCSGTCLMGTCL